MTTDTDKASDKLVEMALKAAFEKGWCAAAQWAQRDDLRHDTGSIAYAGQRDAILAGKAAEVHAAIIADLCWDVEPVAWGIFANNGNIRFWACDKASADSQAAKTGGDVEGIFRASTVAALKAEIEALRKDAERYRWLRDGEIVADYPYPVMALDRRTKPNTAGAAMTHPTDDSLKPCPFCGAGTTEITPKGRMWTGMKYSEPSSVSVRHWCEAVPGQPSRMIERVGRDEASAIDAWNTRALLAEQARPTQVMQEARETLLIAAANFEGVAPSARDRCIRAANALHEVYTAQPLKAEQAKDAAEDAELLDWIFRQGDEFSYYVIQDAPGDGEYVVHGMGCSGQGKTPRAAIRAARAAERKA